MVSARSLGFRVRSRDILASIDFELSAGDFLVVVGENGAGKTTLLDLLLGFRRRTAGDLTVLGHDPEDDPWSTRAGIAYLSEKVDLPGDWTAREFLDFHRRFFPAYDRQEEAALVDRLGVRADTVLGTMSAGEVRRVQIIGGLAARPVLLIADEITALLDIIGRRLFLALIKERQAASGLTTVLATNVPEGLDAYVDRVLLISRGRQLGFSPLSSFVGGDRSLADAVASALTHHDRPLP
jgi:ABC-2 type transport system ATP-binding protein